MKGSMVRGGGEAEMGIEGGGDSGRVVVVGIHGALGELRWGGCWIRRGGAGCLCPWCSQ